LALRAATLYYLDGLTQAEIAARLGVSRPTAGRLIARAKSKGLVRIEVAVPPDMRDDVHADEERELEHRFGLAEAVLAGHGVDVGAPGRPAAYASVGRAAAALLMRRLSPARKPNRDNVSNPIALVTACVCASNRKIPAVPVVPDVVESVYLPRNGSPTRPGFAANA